MKKVISSILVICYILALVPAVIVAVTTVQETIGDCTWTLTGTVLTISGNGEVESGVEPKPWSDKMDKITKVKIKKGITSIGSFAFSDYKNLSSVTIPDSVTSIGSYAFDGTSYFNNQDNWKDGMLYIDDCLIQAKDTIEGTCAIKPGTKVIAEEAFYDCKNLSEIILPSSVTNIGDSAFQGCMNLSRIEIPDSVISIGALAFGNCESLSRIILPNCLKDIGYLAFSDTAYYNDEKNWEKRCEGDVLYLGNYLIEADTMASTYTVKNGTKAIASDAFFTCNDLRSITIPNSVTSIGDNAFNGCDGLTSITIPDSVTSIGDNAFRLCDNLSEIIVPDSIKSIGVEAFIATAYADDEKNWDGNMLYLGNYLIGIKYNEPDIYNIRNGTKVIADDVFSNCKNPSSITIPSSVIHIGEGNDVITSHAYNVNNYSHLIPLIVLPCLAVVVAIVLIIRRSVKKHKTEELR